MTVQKVYGFDDLSNIMNIKDLGKSSGYSKVTNGSAISLKDGTVVNKPKSWLDIIRENWQLVILGIIAIIVLIKD